MLSQPIQDLGPGGGAVELSARNFAGLTSTDGSFDWVIGDQAQSRPASAVIRVLR